VIPKKARGELRFGGPMRSPSAFKLFGVIALLRFGIPWAAPGVAQPAFGQAAQSTASLQHGRTISDSTEGLPDSIRNLPDAPDRQYALDIHPFVAAAMAAAGPDRPWDIAPSGASEQEPFSRIGIGVGISPLGIGASGSIVLTQYIDGRLAGNFLALNVGRFEADGVNVYPGIHLATGEAAVDFYPYNAPIRLSAGLMFLNMNHVAGTMRVAEGTSFKLNGQTFYAGSAGTTPLTGDAEVAFHSIQPAPTLTFGFGKFIPRSNRHWSFPSEYGVAFTGAPSVNVNLAGTVCTDVDLTTCSEVSDTSSEVGAEFNSALQAQMAKWRRSLGHVKIFPILSGGVSYSFNTPWGRTPKAKF
jgi:hypothetical protein